MSLWQISLLKDHSMFHISSTEIASNKIWGIGNTFMALVQFQNNFFSFICYVYVDKNYCLNDNYICMKF